MEDYIAQVHAAKKKRTLIALSLAAVSILLLVFIFVRPGNGARKLTEEAALSRAPALALTDEELALADTILQYEDFRNALNHDLVENTTVFSLEETEAIVGSVIPPEAEVLQIAVSGAVVVIGYRLPYQQVTLQYADADRSGTVDQIHKTLTPIINGASTGCYTLDHNLATGKIQYTHTTF